MSMFMPTPATHPSGQKASTQVRKPPPPPQDSLIYAKSLFLKNISNGRDTVLTYREGETSRKNNRLLQILHSRNGEFYSWITSLSTSIKNAGMPNEEIQYANSIDYLINEFVTTTVILSGIYNTIPNFGTGSIELSTHGGVSTLRPLRIEPSTGKQGELSQLGEFLNTLKKTTGSSNIVGYRRAIPNGSVYKMDRALLQGRSIEELVSMYCQVVMSILYAADKYGFTHQSLSLDAIYLVNVAPFFVINYGVSYVKCINFIAIIDHFEYSVGSYVDSQGKTSFYNGTSHLTKADPISDIFIFTKSIYQGLSDIYSKVGQDDGLRQGVAILRKKLEIFHNLITFFVGDFSLHTPPRDRPQRVVTYLHSGFIELFDYASVPAWLNYLEKVLKDKKLGNIMSVAKYSPGSRDLSGHVPISYDNPHLMPSLQMRFSGRIDTKSTFSSTVANLDFRTLILKQQDIEFIKQLQQLLDAYDSISGITLITKPFRRDAWQEELSRAPQDSPYPIRTLIEYKENFIQNISENGMYAKQRMPLTFTDATYEYKILFDPHDYACISSFFKTYGNEHNNTNPALGSYIRYILYKYPLLYMFSPNEIETLLDCPDYRIILQKFIRELYEEICEITLINIEDASGLTTQVIKTTAIQLITATTGNRR